MFQPPRNYALLKRSQDNVELIFPVIITIQLQKRVNCLFTGAVEEMGTDSRKRRHAWNSVQEFKLKINTKNIQDYDMFYFENF